MEIGIKNWWKLCATGEYKNSHTLTIKSPMMARAIKNYGVE